MKATWPKVSLGEVLTERRETPPTEEMLLGEIPIISKIGFNDGQIELRNDTSTKTGMILIRPGDLVVSGINAAKGAIAIYVGEKDTPIAATIHYAAYIPNKDKADIRYLWWFLRSERFREILTQHLPGGIKTELKAKRLLPIPIPLPPLPEQRLIVAKIEELAAKIEEARNLQKYAIQEAEALLSSALAKVFEPRAGWVKARVSDLCYSPQYGFTASSSWESVGPKFLRITDIQNGKVNWEAVPYCECSQVEKYRLLKNDILFARTGATTGKSYLIRNCPEAIFASYLIRIRVKHSVTPEYLYRYFQSPPYWKQIHEQKKGTGQPNLNGKKLANLSVPFPRDKDDQLRITSYLDDLQKKVDKLKQLQEQTTAKLDALLPSILDKAFKGKLN